MYLKYYVMLTIIGCLCTVEKISAENNDCHYLCLESDSECGSSVNLCVQSNIKQTQTASNKKWMGQMSTSCSNLVSIFFKLRILQFLDYRSIGQWLMSHCLTPLYIPANTEKFHKKQQTCRQIWNWTGNLADPRISTNCRNHFVQLSSGMAQISPL